MERAGEKDMQAKGVAGACPRLDKAGTLALLDEAGIAYELCEHKAVRSVEEADTVAIPFAADMAKNLFLHDATKSHVRRRYFLVTVPDHKQISLAALADALGSSRLSFASEADLDAMLGVWPGAVTPFAALNDADARVEVYLDADFARRGWIGCHPCDNTASVHLRTAELADLLATRGHKVTFLEL